MNAFLTALLLFLATVTICHFYARGRVAVNNPEFSTWPGEAKGISLAGLSENMNEGSMVVFGSSEFQHGTDTIYHPANVFAGNRFNPMLVGAGYYQSLSHAVTLAAVEPELKLRKAVLILSPQWFRKTGVVEQAYTSRFSEVLYAAMLENQRVGDETKAYIARRTEQLLSKNDSRTMEHTVLDKRVLWQGSGTFFENLQQKIWNAFLQEKDWFSMAMSQVTAGIRKGNGIPDTEEEPDWESLMNQAEADGKRENTNLFYINNDSYKLLEPYLDLKKDMNQDAVKGYQTGPEFDDLQCFLQVCRETGIEPMLVILPVNGYYYDFTGFPREARDGYYHKVQSIAEEYGARVADFSDQEYTRYFFEDRVHIGKKGWVMVCESLYDFYRE